VGQLASAMATEKSESNVLSELSALQSLSFTDTGADGGGEACVKPDIGGRPLMHAIGSVNTVTQLTVARCAVTGRMALALFKRLPDLTALKALNLNDLSLAHEDYSVTVSARAYLMRIVAKCTGLEVLGIKGLGWAEPCGWVCGFELEVCSFLYHCHA
jgi:hypothetical protein